MLCDDVKRIAYFFLDEQLGEQKKQDVRSHLDECKDCDGRLTIHKRLRAFLQRRLERCCAPDKLRTRLATSFRSQRSES